jgi:hypothetical protein
MTTLVQILKPFYSTEGLLNSGDVVGLPDATATAMVAAGTAVEVDEGAGAGTPTTSPFRGQIASETDAQFVAAGGSSGDENPSAAIQGFQGDVTTIRGRAVPNSLIGDAL